MGYATLKSLTKKLGLKTTVDEATKTKRDIIRGMIIKGENLREAVSNETLSGGQICIQCKCGNSTRIYHSEDTSDILAICSRCGENYMVMTESLSLDSSFKYSSCYHVSKEDANTIIELVSKGECKDRTISF